MITKGADLLMELDELVTKIINHIDETAVKTENKLKQEIHQTKTDIMRAVNVLLEQQRDTLIQFTDTRAAAIEDRLTASEDRLGQQIFDVHQKIDKLAADQKDIHTKLNSLDREFENQLRRTK